MDTLEWGADEDQDFDDFGFEYHHKKSYGNSYTSPFGEFLNQSLNFEDTNMLESNQLMTSPLSSFSFDLVKPEMDTDSYFYQNSSSQIKEEPVYFHFNPPPPQLPPQNSFIKQETNNRLPIHIFVMAHFTTQAN